MSNVLKKLRKGMGNRTTPNDFRIHKNEARALEPYIVQLLCDIGREGPLNDPHAMYALLRMSFAPAYAPVVAVKDTGKRATPSARRFSRLIEAMGSLLPVPEAAARRCATMADAHRGDTEPFPARDADVGWHFARSSSSMLAGRVLAATVRYMRPGRCLEIGTAYGFSATIIASALERLLPDWRLLTIEVGDIQYRRASALLAGHFGERVICRRGRSEDILAEAAAEMAPIDFVFHDGGHSEENYVRDFEAVIDALGPGAVVIFDDIRWRDRDKPDVDPRCYKGWLRVVAHPRVERAVEVGPALGLLLVS